jgi:hypothetical protein
LWDREHIRRFDNRKLFWYAKKRRCTSKEKRRFGTRWENWITFSSFGVRSHLFFSTDIILLKKDERETSSLNNLPFPSGQKAFWLV